MSKIGQIRIFEFSPLNSANQYRIDRLTCQSGQYGLCAMTSLPRHVCQMWTENQIYAKNKFLVLFSGAFYGITCYCHKRGHMCGSIAQWPLYYYVGTAVIF